jgi:putative oxidoreductase
MDNMTKQGLPALVVYFVVFTEFFGALMMLLGLCTRLVAVCYVALMVGAIATVHGKHGFFMNWFGQQQGEGFEYHLLVIGIALALLVMGGGKLSADRAIARRDTVRTTTVR